MKDGPSIAGVILTAIITSIITAAVTVLVMSKLDLISGGDMVTVPNVVGLNQNDAGMNLQSQGLTLIIGGRKPSRSSPIGTVLSQTPHPGSQAKRGSSLTVTLAGEAPSVPDLKGRTIAEATVLLEQAGFKIQVGEPVPHETIPKGKIAAQVPSAGTNYEPGRSIVIKPSDGPGTIPVPKLTGMFLRKAKQLIQDKGFKVGQIKWSYSEDWDAFMVLNQTPAAGEKAKPGSAIDLVANEE
ncbi:MAG: PASTA domain-containing protein [Deltaproteobacteria bacterium]|nr:PASTA domain-containing protein [Deltaproteobacteria bacterium]